jgi:hypothetical protein
VEQATDDRRSRNGVHSAARFVKGSAFTRMDLRESERQHKESLSERMGRDLDTERMAKLPFGEGDADIYNLTVSVTAINSF